MYDGAPFVEAWKPLPPLLHAERRESTRSRSAASPWPPSRCSDPTAMPLTVCRSPRPATYAASVGARLPTEFEWQLAADQPSFRLAVPLVWNLTESEHTDGVTRFVILKGGSAYDAAGSEWYFDGGPRQPSFSAKLLLGGLGVDRSSWIGFRLAWDLERAWVLADYRPRAQSSAKEHAMSAKKFLVRVASMNICSI